VPKTKSRDPRIHTDGYEVVPLASLERYPGNAKQHDIDAIRESLRASGFVGALTVQTSTRRLLAGNGTWEALGLEEFEEVPVVWRDCDDAEARRIVLAFNRVAERGHFDNGALALLLQAAADDEGGLLGTGYIDGDLAALLADRGEDRPAIGGVDPDDVGAGDGYQEQYGVIVICDDETNQREVYEALRDAGYNCRVVTT
jgi:ParB-like chromosome segregation protein Spo0J